MRCVTSAEFQRHFGRCREAALTEPLGITNHGRDSLVLLSAEEYGRLTRGHRQTMFVWELPAADLAALAAAQAPAESAQFDGELTG